MWNNWLQNVMPEYRLHVASSPGLTMCSNNMQDFRHEHITVQVCGGFLYKLWITLGKVFMLVIDVHCAREVYWKGRQIQHRTPEPTFHCISLSATYWDARIQLQTKLDGIVYCKERLAYTLWLQHVLLILIFSLNNWLVYMYTSHCLHMHSQGPYLS